MLKLIILIYLNLFLKNVELCENAEKNNIKIEIPELGALIGSKSLTKWSNETIFQFMGIPYAESPSNNRRFKAPVPKAKWNKIHNGTKFGRPCPNYDYYSKLTNEEKLEDVEDCLHLYIYTKDLNKSKPVMVFIHGGGLVDGAATYYMPNYLLEKDVVFVAIQYRLGALGFISTKTKAIPGNMGVLDSILALEWIQKYIQYFGGDAKQITVFGESAGATIVSLLTVSPKVKKNLFKRAILQSGSHLMSALYNKNPINEAKETCKKISCANCENVNDINKCFKSANLESLLNSSITKGFPYALISNDYEGVVPGELIKLTENKQNIYDVMIGINQQDGAFFINPQDLNTTLEKYADYLLTIFGEDNFAGITGNLLLRLLFTLDELNQKEINVKNMLPSLADMISTIGFKAPIKKYVEIHSDYLNDNKIYLYTFDYVGEFNYLTYLTTLKTLIPYYPIVNGTHHADDLLYLFPTHSDEYNLNSEDQEMAKQMIELWTSFAINGIPTTNNGKTNLPNVKTSNGPYFRINKKITIGNNFVDEFFVSKAIAEKNIS